MRMYLTTISCLVLTAVWLASVSWTVRKPTVFLLGDSISIHYGPYLKTFVSDFAVLEQKQTETLSGREFTRNGGDSKRVLDYISFKLRENNFQPDFLLFNCGLHDIGRDTNTNELQVALTAYQDNLERIISLVRDRGIRMIWITITPVVDSIHNSRTKQKKRYAADQFEYNRAALEICKRHRIPVIDLFSFTRQLGTEAYIDNVHYKEEVRKLQAAYIAGSLNELLNTETQQVP